MKKKLPLYCTGCGKKLVLDVKRDYDEEYDGHTGKKLPPKYEVCLICPAITTDGCDPDFDDPRFQNRVLYDVSEKKLKGLKKIYREYSLPDLLKNESKRRSFFRLLALK